MRQARFATSVVWVLVILMLPVHLATAQSGASATANSSTNASANANGKAVNASAGANASANAQANTDAGARAAAEKKAEAQARAEAAAKAAAAKAAEKKAEAQAKADAQVSAAAAKKAEAQAKADAAAQTNVTLNKPSWQAVMDKLFGTPDSGLLDGQKAFQFRAEGVTMTGDQAASFFGSSSASTQDLAALIEAAAALHGQVRMDGMIDGKPFDLKLAGRELKIEGISLTSAQRESLMAELRGISALHEAKIDALVDGRASRIQLAGGRDRLELLGRDRNDGDRPKIDLDTKGALDAGGRVETGRTESSGRVESTGRVETGRTETSGRVESTGRVESGRVESTGRVEGTGRVEIPEKPVRSVLGR